MCIVQCRMKEFLIYRGLKKEVHVEGRREGWLPVGDSDSPPNHTTPPYVHQTTPHHRMYTIPHHITSHHTEPHHTTPPPYVHQTTPHHITLNDTTQHHHRMFTKPLYTTGAHTHLYMWPWSDWEKQTTAHTNVRLMIPVVEARSWTLY